MAKAPVRGGRSPWGKIQTVETILLGHIWEVTTASHGGIKVSRSAQAEIAKKICVEGSWYEEDVNWAIPAMVFPDAFEAWHPGIVEIANKTVEYWLPDEYLQLNR